jgi:hypothetical protein
VRKQTTTTAPPTSVVNAPVLSEPSTEPASPASTASRTPPSSVRLPQPAPARGGAAPRAATPEPPAPAPQAPSSPAAPAPPPSGPSTPSSSPPTSPNPVCQVRPELCP